MDISIDKSCLKIKVFELNFINVKKKGSFAIKIQSIKSEFKPVSTKYVNTSLKWEEAFEIELKNKNFEDEIDITLHQKSFFLSESCLGGVTIPLSILKDDSSRLLKDWITLNPILKKKPESGSNTPNAQRYILSTPLAELLICIQLDYTTEELKKYLSTYHQKLQDHISDTMKLLQEEEDNDALVELRIRDVNSSTNSSIPNILLTKNFPNLGEDKKRKRISVENAVEKESFESETEHLPTELLEVEDLDDKYDLKKSPKPTSKYSNNTFELTSSNGDLNLQMNAYQQYFDESKLDVETVSENDTDEDLPSEFESPIFKRKTDHYNEDSSDIYKSVIPVETTYDDNILKRSHINLPKICIEEELSVVQDKKFLFEYLSFNDRFQSAVEKMKSNKMAELGEASDLLINVAEDFLWTAKTYGKIIISEFKLPDHLKTIKPQIDNKGILGGTKYYYKGIFYKLAEADGGIISNIESAAKIAGHELKGCSSYYNTSVAGISYPLIASIDYRGFRLIAMTVLPINEKTLVVGTENGGKSIKSGNKVLNKKLEKAGKILNIKPHYVFDHLMYSACDLEGHKAEDGRYYLIDFSRVMPPEFPSHPEDIFYKLLRPEFVSGYHLPLSSDAFSGFRGKDSLPNNFDAKMATEDLHKHIKSFARELSESVDKEIEDNWDNILTFHQRFSRIIHQAGINMRHLGMMFNHSTTYNCKMLLLIEMSARAIKHILRQKMRQLMTEFKYPTEHHYISIVVKYMNQVFGSMDVWEEIMERCVQYFKIDKHDSIKSLKTRHDLQSHRRDHKSSRKSNENKFHKERSSVGINELYFVSMEDIFSRSSSENDFKRNSLGNESPEREKDSIMDRGSILSKSRRSGVTEEVSDSYEELDPTPLDLSFYISCFGGGLSLLFFRITRMMGFHFSSRINKQFMAAFKNKSQNPRFLQMKNCFDRSDLETLGERIKHMNIIAQAQARIFHQKAKQSVTQMDTEYFYQMAIEKLEDALDANPTSKTTLMTYAEILLDIQISTTEKTVFSFESPEIQKINQFYELARKYDPNDPIVLGNYARFLSKCGEYDRARIFYLNSIYLDITRSWPVERYASLLSDLGEKDKAEHFYSIWNKFIVLYKSKNKNSRSGSYMKPSKSKSQLKK